MICYIGTNIEEVKTVLERKDFDEGDEYDDLFNNFKKWLASKIREYAPESKILGKLPDIEKIESYTPYIPMPIITARNRVSYIMVSEQDLKSKTGSIADYAKLPVGDDKFVYFRLLNEPDKEVYLSSGVSQQKRYLYDPKQLQIITIRKDGKLTNAVFTKILDVLESSVSQPESALTKKRMRDESTADTGATPYKRSTTGYSLDSTRKSLTGLFDGLSDDAKDVVKDLQVEKEKVDAEKRQMLKEEESAQEKVADLQTRLFESEKATDRYRLELKNTEEDIVKLINKLEDTEKKLEESERSNNSLEVVKKQLEDTNVAVNELNNERQDEIAKLQVQLDKKAKEELLLKEQIDDFKKASDKVKIKNGEQIQRKESEKKTLQEQAMKDNEEIRKQNKELTTLKEKLKTVQDEKNELEKTLQEQEKKDRDELGKRSKELTTLKEKLMEEVRESERKEMGHKGKLKELNKQVNQQKKEIESKETKLQKLQYNLQQQQNLVDKLKEEVKGLRVQLVSTEKSRNNYQNAEKKWQVKYENAVEKMKVMTQKRKSNGANDRGIKKDEALLHLASLPKLFAENINISDYNKVMQAYDRVVERNEATRIRLQELLRRQNKAQCIGSDIGNVLDAYGGAIEKEAQTRSRLNELLGRQNEALDAISNDHGPLLLIRSHKDEDEDDDLKETLLTEIQQQSNYVLHELRGELQAIDERLDSLTRSIDEKVMSL